MIQPFRKITLEVYVPENPPDEGQITIDPNFARGYVVECLEQPGIRFVHVKDEQTVSVDERDFVKQMAETVHTEST